jgi:hypothetical protein
VSTSLSVLVRVRVPSCIFLCDDVFLCVVVCAHIFVNLLIYTWLMSICVSVGMCLRILLCSRGYTRTSVCVRRYICNFVILGEYKLV